MSSQSYFFNPQDDRMAFAGNGIQLPRLTSTQRLALAVAANDAGRDLSTTRVASTSLTIVSSSATDTSVVEWMFVNP